MALEIDDTLVILMLESLQACANAVELNGPAQYMLARELADLGKPIDTITLGELQAALDRTDIRYHRMEERYRSLREPVPSGNTVLRMVTRGRVWVNGLDFTSAELVQLDGQEVCIDFVDDSYSLLAWADDGKNQVFQIHHMPGTCRQGVAGRNSTQGTEVSAEWLNALAPSRPGSAEGSEPDPEKGE